MASCTPKRIASDITSQIMVGGAPSFEMEGDLEVAREAGLTMIKMIEAFSYDNPKNKNYNTLLARSYANYAFAFLETDILFFKDSNSAQYETSKNRAQNFYERGKTYGLRVLNRKDAFAKAYAAGDLEMLKKAVSQLGKAQMPALFWTAFNWGSWINLNRNSMLAVADLAKAEVMMNRVLEQDPNYFYATPRLFFGVLYGSRPTMFGGNPEKSKKHFEEALQAFERKFLMAHVMYASTYAIQYQDKALFESLLNEVLRSPADVLPAQNLANSIAKKRAEFLLANANSLF